MSLNHPSRSRIRVAPCPRCGFDYDEIRPAISRTDDRTFICSECGTEEAIELWIGELTTQAEWHSNEVKP